MNQEQKFDRIIKKKVDEAEFPFDEQNWNKLSAQLDAERRIATSKGWGKFLFLGLLFLGITSASIALYKIQGPLGFKDKLAGNISSNENSGSPAQAQGANGNKNAENNLLASNNKSNGVTNYVSDNLNDAANVSNSNSEVVPGNTISGDNNPGGNLNAKSTSGNNLNSADEITSKNKSVNAIIQKRMQHSSFNKQSAASDKNEISASKENNSGNRNVTGTGSFEEVAANDFTGGTNFDHTYLDRIDARIPILFSNRNVKANALKIPNWYEEDYHRKGKKRLSFLNIEAGGALMSGWDSKDGKDGRGLNWYAGVNYGKFLSRKIGFSAGAQFYNIGNIKQPFYESSKSVYGLGSTSTNTVITTQSLSYFAVPVKFYYAIKPAHQIGVGVNSSFLFSSKNVIENYRLTDNIKSSESISKTSGIYEGIRLNNILVSAFYRVKINKRMFVNTEVLYGMRDIFKNTDLNNYQQKPLGLRVGVQYTLFEK